MIVGGREAGKVVDRLKAEGRPGRPPARLPRGAQGPDRGRVPQARRRASATSRSRVLADRAREVEGAGRDRAGPGEGRASGSPSPATGWPSPRRSTPRSARLIAAGLPAEAAVAALTRRAAEIAGLGDRLGTIEPGKLGHLVVLTAPFGDETAKVRYVLVDGLKFDLDQARPPTARRPAETSRRPSGRRPSRPTKADEPAKAEARAEPPSRPSPTAAARPKADAGRRRAEPRPKTPEDQPPATPFVDIATEFDADRKPDDQDRRQRPDQGRHDPDRHQGDDRPRGRSWSQNGKIAAVGPDVEAARGRARSSRRPGWSPCPGSSTRIRTSPSRAASTR